MDARNRSESGNATLLPLMAWVAALTVAALMIGVIAINMTP